MPPIGAAGPGQAAILLVESLIHGLIARSVISVADAVEIVAIAADTQQEIDAEPRDPNHPTPSSQTLLDAIVDSIAHDLPN